MDGSTLSLLTDVLLEFLDQSSLAGIRVAKENEVALPHILMGLSFLGQDLVSQVALRATLVPRFFASSSHDYIEIKI